MSDEGWDEENGAYASLLYIHQTFISLRGEGNKVISWLHTATASAVPRRKTSWQREVPFHTSILMVTLETRQEHIKLFLNHLPAELKSLLDYVHIALPEQPPEPATRRMLLHSFSTVCRQDLIQTSDCV